MGTVRGFLLSRRFLSAFRRRSLHFVVGVPRSGTSLCRMLLGSHPRIWAPSETPWVFGAYGFDSSLGALVRALCTSKFGPVSSITGVSTTDIHLAAERFVLAIFDSKMRAEGKDVLILKTPDDIAFVDEILEVFCRSVVIHVRRDVRDVALSTARMEWPCLNLFGENNFENSVRRWVAWEGKVEVARMRNPDRIISVRYEDLVLSPATALNRVLQKLHLSFNPDMLSYWKQTHDVPEWDIGSLNAAEFGNIEPARAFAHRMYVPSDEQRRIIADHESEIVALGYDPGWGQ
jgi:protein-tyrosine sulfotransferase